MKISTIVFLSTAIVMVCFAMWQVFAHKRWKQARLDFLERKFGKGLNDEEIVDEFGKGNLVLLLGLAVICCLLAYGNES
jgi:sulfite exporter TauE/SafE